MYTGVLRLSGQTWEGVYSNSEQNIAMILGCLNL